VTLRSCGKALSVATLVLASHVACGGSHAPPSPAGSASGGAGGEAGASSAAAGDSDRGHSGDTSHGGEAGGTAGSGDAGAAGATVELGMFAALATGFCAAARACCAEAGQSLQALDTCEAGFAEQVDAVRLVTRGTVRLDESALAACADAYAGAAASCSLADVTARCHGILLGTRSVGETCTDVLECDRTEGDRVCVVDRAGEGRCRATRRAGADASCFGSCEMGVSCSSTNFSTDASTWLCYEADGLYCSPETAACAPIASAGAPCDDDAACGSTAYCDGECATRGGVNAACDFGYACMKGLVCTDGRCQVPPFVTGYVCLGHLPEALD